MSQAAGWPALIIPAGRSGDREAAGLLQPNWGPHCAQFVH